MDKKELLKNLSKEADGDIVFRTEALKVILNDPKRLNSDAIETLKHMIRSNGIQFSRPEVMNDNRVALRELNTYIAERIGYCYIFEPNQSDHRVYDSVVQFCNLITEENFQNLQFYAMANFRIQLIDIFDLKEKISAKLDKV